MTSISSGASDGASPDTNPSGTASAQRWWPPAAVLIGAVCSIASGAIHVAASQTHLEHLGLSRLILAEGAMQIALGATLLAASSMLMKLAAAGVNAVAVASWASTRATGISWVGGLEAAEAPQAADTVTAVLAGLAFVSLIVALVGDRAAATSPMSATPARRLFVATTAVAAIALSMFGINRLGSHDHGDHGDGDVTVAAADAWKIGATDAEVTDTERLVAETQEIVRSFTSVGDAESKGFVRINADHLLKVDRVFDDHQLDASNIESLVVGNRDGEDYIRGGMYLLDVGQTTRDVPRFGGPLMVWHSHGGFCFEPTGVIQAGPEAGGTCPEGSYWVDDPPMVHIYTEAQVDDGSERNLEACGTFTYMDLPFDEPVPGCGSEINNEHAGHAHE